MGKGMIAEGRLRHQQTGQEETYTVHVLSIEALEELQAMQKKVEEDVSDPSTLQPLSEEEFTNILKGDGLLIGVYAGQTLAAFRALWYPGHHIENLGRDTGLPESEWEQVVHQEISCVLPEYRGNGLQKKMGVWIMDAFQQSSHDKTHLFCTVHPDNPGSLKDKFSQGMVIAAVKEKYAGMLRYIFYRPVSGPVHWDESTVVTVRQRDYDEQKSLIENGYVGVQWHPSTLLFAKKQP